ncbi:MAG: TlpA family protein disulfide reductase, partial [Bacteroidetes bacterium]|nr:TlpA family protein disulfide reductase [Bacteroidota bacterium]
DSMRLTAIVPEYRQIAENIHEKVIKLNKGTRAPDFDLYDIDSNLVGLKDFRGKFLYIGFYTTLSFSCKEDIEPLKALRKKHGHAYSIVSVFIDDDFRAAVDFMRDNGCKWTLLHYGNRPEILKQYDVRAYPTYYLIDPDGNLSMSPAPGPDEDFETRFYEVIKTWRK